MQRLVASLAIEIPDPTRPRSRAGIRRYQCSTRRYHGNCEQTMVKAQALEAQLIDWVHTFQPDEQLRKLILDTLRAETESQPDNNATRRAELLIQLERLRDLYLMGDYIKPQYIMRRQALEEELQRTAPPATPNLDRAQELLEDFARFWEAEPNPAERRKLIATLFQHVWQKDGSIVAVKPQAAFAKYFVAANEARAKHPKADPKSRVTKAGATGVKPAIVTPEIRL